MIDILGKYVSDKIITDKGAIYDVIVSHIKETFQVDVFACESTPSIKYIKEGQVYIYYDQNRIVDFTQLGMPKGHNDYEDRTFKYIFVEKSLFSSERAVTKKEVIEKIKFLVLNIKETYNE